ncbi:DNA-binding transcriptional LysR family regulator [Haloferula luteola]|uniref:DNA-binding transcriptional LysR family regulator n=1 Tax=Haloferula luteola TaxID=595692 RepID=A0A840V8A8_9BACT|nr:LysR family transcriptional regulator [Haloferula luteola]MBB5353286.1 DNA-binding transcriptional LysR family regulator [Haloferula luteola]
MHTACGWRLDEAGIPATLRGMESKLVRAFIKVAEMGTITAAASKLGLTQPALSRRIRTLEEELGVELLKREAHSVSLTPAGQVLFRDGRKWLAMGAQVRQRVCEAGHGAILRVGYSPSLAGPFLGLALERFNQIHPKVRVQLSDLSTAEMKDGLIAGRLDLIVTVFEEKEEGLEWELLECRPWRLAVAMRHRFAEASAVDVAQVAQEGLLMYAREGYPDYWKRVGEYFAEQGISPRVVGEFDGFSSLAMAVEAGIGVAMVANAGQDANRPGIRFVALEPSPSAIRVGVGWGKSPTPACQVLIQELKASARSSGGEATEGGEL